MTETWNFSALIDRLRCQFDEEHLKKSIQPLNSISQNQVYCRYHYQEFKRLHQKHSAELKEEGVTEEGLVARVFKEGDHASKEYEFKIGCEAHINALLRNLHSNSDLLAHVVYFCLNLENDPRTQIKESSISLFELKEKLKSKLEYEDLYSLLVVYTGGGDYKYFKAWGNHTKHWSNISVQLTYNLKEVGEAIYSWNFEAFSFRERNYLKKDALAFIEREYDRQSELLPKIIREVDLLNAKLFEN